MKRKQNREKKRKERKREEQQLNKSSFWLHSFTSPPTYPICSGKDSAPLL